VRGRTFTNRKPVVASRPPKSPNRGTTESILDPAILTIRFARRVSTYKRLPRTDPQGLPIDRVLGVERHQLGPRPWGLAHPRAVKRGIVWRSFAGLSDVIEVERDDFANGPPTAPTL